MADRYMVHGSKLTPEDRVATAVLMEAQRAGLDVQPYDIAKALIQGNASHPDVVRFRQAVKSTPAPEPGWTKERIQQLGRNPEPRELSPAGRAAAQRNQNLKLLDSLLSPTSTGHDKLNAHATWENEGGASGKTHGESGYLGALGNPEYTAGWVLNNLQPWADAAWMQASGQNAPGEQTLAAERYNPLKKIAGVTGRYFGHLADAADLADARAMASRVERVIPEGMSIKEGNKALEQSAEAGGANFDDWYRKKYGDWPSYALSSAAVFGNGLIDPTLPASGIAGALTRGAARPGLGSALKTAGKIAAHETVDELPTNVAVMAATAALPQIGQSSDPLKRTMPHLPTNWLGGGADRTDLERPMKSPEGEFAGFGYEKPDAFAERMKQEDMEPLVRKGIPSLKEQVRRSLLQP